jgi:hypothetical protein
VIHRHQWARLSATSASRLGITVFAARWKSAFCAIESALYRNLDRVSRRVGQFRPLQSKLIGRGEEAKARDRRTIWPPQLISRNFSRLTLTSSKPRTLNSSVNRAFVTFTVFFTSN